MSVRILSFIFFLSLSTVHTFAQGELLLNELMADNESTILDVDGEPSDWIELYNASSSVLNLKDYTISDSNASWEFPDFEINPNNYLVIFASDKDKLEEGELHTNFKLDRDGEEIIIQNPNGDIVQRISFPSLGVDESYARSPVEIEVWNVSTQTTPNQENILIVEERDLYALSSNQANGFYPGGLALSLLDVLPGDEVYYTLDGSLPNTNSRLYNAIEGIRIEEAIPGDIANISTSDEWEPPAQNFQKAAILRAVAYRGQVKVSQVLNQTFWLSSNPHSLPIISLVGEERDFFDDETGIYVKGNAENYFQESLDWERPIHASFFDTAGDLQLDQSAGIRLGGARTRLEPQKTMRLYARSNYGNSHFEYPFWGEDYGDRFKRITLRTLDVGPWGRASIMDDLIHQIIDGELNTDYVRRNFAVVYLNGIYWGIHSMREHNNQHFVERKYNVPEDEVLIARGTVNERTETNVFDELVNDIFLMDLRDSLDFQEVASRLDVEQYADYVISNLAFSNRDWPHNNVEYWSSDSYDGKIRFIVNDLDATMLVHNDERLDLFITDQAVRLERDKWVRVLVFLQKLLERPAYRTYFNRRLNELLYTTFAPDRTLGILEEMVETLGGEMESHINRWHFPNSMNQWETAIDKLEEFLLRRPLYLIERSNELFGFPISAYPNPVINSLNIEFDAWEEGTVNIGIYDMSGRLLRQTTEHVSEGLQKLEMNLQILLPGAYILRANFKGLQINQRLIKIEE